MECPFCVPHENDAGFSTENIFARYDENPVAPGHMLLIPIRHVESWFDLTEDEVRHLHALSRLVSAMVHHDGWTIGVNEGNAAGRTVSHLHLHMIPRRIGDVDNPRGGIRGVIPDKKIPGVS